MGSYAPGQEVEVDEELAGHLCHVNVTDSFKGEARAVTLEVAKKAEKEAKKIENMTSAEAAEAGVKNIVDSSVGLPKAEKKPVKDEEKEEEVDL